MKFKLAIFLILFLCIFINLVRATEINISDLTIEEKIGQMLMVKSNEGLNAKYLSLGVGGIFLDGGKNVSNFKNIIQEYQNKSKIKLLVATDLEGYWNPFSDYSSKSFGDITNAKEAKILGKEHAKILKDPGFNLDFSPVVESKNKVWPGRSFEGNNSERKEKIAKYIESLQEEGIIATAKHYPGGSMEKNPHYRLVRAKIDLQDLENFNYSIAVGVGAVMVGHVIVSGEIDSKGKPTSASKEVIKKLRTDFTGLIITDDINMLGLRLKYLFQRNKMCVDLVKAGNDIILDSWKPEPKNVGKCINAIKKAVSKGEISSEQIDHTVVRILKAKGYALSK